MPRPDVPRPALDPEILEASEEVATRPGPPARPLGLTPDGRLKAGRLAGLTMGGAIWVLAWPVMLESFLNSLVGLTDTVLAAGIDTATTDAVGVATYAMWFTGLIIMALGMGATALISRSVGKRRMAVASAALGQSMLLGMVMGVVLGVFLWLAAPFFAGLVNMSGPAREAFMTYLRILAFGLPLETVMFVLIACARGAGDNITPLWAMVARNIVNVIVSFSLAGVDLTSTRIVDGEAVSTVIFANPFGFDMGVRGIALGTVLSDVLGLALVLMAARSGRWGITLRAKRMRPHWHTLRRIIRVGLPNFIETLGMWVGNFMVLIVVGFLNEPGLFGVHALAIRIESLSFLPGFAMGLAAATLAGQYLGAGSPELARRAVLICTGVSVAIMGLMGAALIIIPRPIVGVLSDQAIHLQETPALLMLAGVMQVPFAMAIVFRQALRGVGDVRVVLLITWITTYLVRLPLTFLLSGADIPIPAWAGGGIIENPSPVAWGLWGVWLGLSAEIVVVRAPLFAIRFLRGDWAKARV